MSISNGSENDFVHFQFIRFRMTTSLKLSSINSFNVMNVGSVRNLQDPEPVCSTKIICARYDRNDQRMLKPVRSLVNEIIKRAISGP